MCGFESALEFVREHVPSARPRDVLFGIEFAGNYGFTFAHYLRDAGFPVVNVLGAHSKRWKEVVHNQRLKTDPKDAVTITDLVSQGHFVSFPFLRQEYADLRYLVSMRERLAKLRSGAIVRTKDILQVVWPEFERRFPNFNKKTPLALLAAFPCAEAFVSAPRRTALKVIHAASKGKLGPVMYKQLLAATKRSVALAGAQGVLRTEISHQLRLIAEYEEQIATVEALMVEALVAVPEGQYLCSIPKLGPVTAAVFLGSIGDPQAYDSSRQALRVGGLSLVVQESGVQRGRPKLSKRGRPELRRQMYMFAVRNVTRDGLYRERYLNALALNPQKPKKKILIAIARDAARMMFSIARNQRLYTPERPM
jgi:transposase